MLKSRVAVSLSFTFVVVFLVAGQARAQPPCGLAQLFALADEVRSSSDYLDYYTLALSFKTSSSLETASKSASSFGLNANSLFTALDMDTSEQSFRKLQQMSDLQIQEALGSKFSTKYSQRGVPREAYDVAKACLDSKGVHVWQQRPSENRITIKASYSPLVMKGQTPPTAAEVKLTWDPRYGYCEANTINPTIGSEASVGCTRYEFHPRSEFVIHANGFGLTSGSAGPFTLPIIPPPPVPIERCLEPRLLSGRAGDLRVNRVEINGSPATGPGEAGKGSLIDGEQDDAHAWNSQTPGAGMIEIELGHPTLLTRMEVILNGGGPAEYYLTGVKANGTSVVLKHFKGSVVDRQSIIGDGLTGEDGKFTKVRLEIAQSQNWMAFREIAVSGCPLK
jgi:hypothetical protein